MAYENIGKETEQVEFKKSTGELKEGVISIASILNKHDSGDLYFGVKNNGDVIGQEIGDISKRDVSQAIRANIKPPIYPMIEEQHYGDRDVIHVQFEGKRRPYVAYGIPRIRVDDEDVQMDQEIYREMLNARENRTDSWETRLSKYRISDIDKEVFDGYLRKARQVGRISLDSDDPEYVMTKLELADGDTLLNAGAALFVDCGINELQMARFASDERLTFNDIKRYTGSILGLADKAILYVADAMDWRVEFDGSLERKEYPEIPTDAVREAVINAFGHRIIESGQSVEVAIYKSFIEIYSPGKFPDNVTPEQFITEIRKPIRRNPLITRTLYYSKDMESFATGLKRINEACVNAGVKVEFYGDEYGFTVRFYRHCGEGWDDSKALKRQNDALNEKETNTETYHTSTEAHRTSTETDTEMKLTKTEKDLIKLIEKNPTITITKMSEMSGLSRGGVQYVLNSLKSKGKIRREGSQKKGRWIVIS